MMIDSLRKRLIEALATADEHICSQGETIHYDKMADAAIEVFQHFFYSERGW